MKTAVTGENGAGHIVYNYQSIAAHLATRESR